MHQFANTDNAYRGYSSTLRYSRLTYKDDIFYLNQIITAPYCFGLGNNKKDGKKANTRPRRTKFYRIKTMHGQICNINMDSAAKTETVNKLYSYYN
ncbi:MAG: hypothetical protein ABIH00_03790 [Armatimonadota bacterium]